MGKPKHMDVFESTLSLCAFLQLNLSPLVILGISRESMNVPRGTPTLMDSQAAFDGGEALLDVIQHWDKYSWAPIYHAMPNKPLWLWPTYFQSSVHPKIWYNQGHINHKTRSQNITRFFQLLPHDQQIFREREKSASQKDQKSFSPLDRLLSTSWSVNKSR